MPFEVGESINYVADKVASAPIVRTIVRNPFYTALFIVVIIILVMLFVFRNADVETEDDDSTLTLTLRGGIYLLIIITGIMFLHNKNLLQETKAAGRDKEAERIFETMDDGHHDKADLVPVDIDVNFAR